MCAPEGQVGECVDVVVPRHGEQPESGSGQPGCGDRGQHRAACPGGGTGRQDGPGLLDEVHPSADGRDRGLPGGRGGAAARAAGCSGPRDLGDDVTALGRLAVSVVGLDDLGFQDPQELLPAELLATRPGQGALRGGVRVGRAVVHRLQQPGAGSRVLHPRAGPARAVLGEATLHATELLEGVGHHRGDHLVLLARVEEPVGPRRGLQGDRVGRTLDGRLCAGLELVGPAAQRDAVLGERAGRGLDDLVERPPPQGDLLEAEADVHVVAGVDGVVLAAGLHVGDALQEEELLAVQPLRSSRNPQHAPGHHVLEPVRQAGAAIARDAGRRLLPRSLALHLGERRSDGGVAGGPLQPEHAGGASCGCRRLPDRRGGPCGCRSTGGGAAARPARAGRVVHGSSSRTGGSTPPAQTRPRNGWPGRSGGGVRCPKRQRRCWRRCRADGAAG